VFSIKKNFDKKKNLVLLNLEKMVLFKLHFFEIFTQITFLKLLAKFKKVFTVSFLKI